MLFKYHNKITVVDKARLRGNILDGKRGFRQQTGSMVESGF